MPVDLVPFPRVVVDRLGVIDVDADAVLRRAGLSRAHVEGAQPRISTRAFLAFWRSIEEVSGARDVGLRLGSEALPHQYDVASMAALHAPNVGEALKTVARYKRLVCPEEIVIERARGEVSVRFHWILTDENLPMRLVDASFASTLELARRGTGKPIAVKRLELTRRAVDAALLQRHYGCPVVFDAPLDLLVFDERVLDEPFITHNADLLSILLPGLDRELGQAGGAPSLADDVRSAVSRRMRGEKLSVDKIASSMGMSGRTLQRRLGEAGTSYQEILDAVRRQSALRLLESTDLDAGEIAFLLGFEELNSFARAFHAWEGTTPTRWRSARAGAS